MNYVLAIPVFILVLISFSFLIEKINNFYLLLFLITPLSIPIAFSGGLDLSMPSEGVLLILIPIVVLKIIAGLKLNSKVLFHPITLILAIDIAWSLIATLLSEDFSVSIKRTVLKSIFFIVYILFFSHYFIENKKAGNLYKFYLFGMIIPIVSTLYQHSLLGFSQPTSIYVSQPFFVDHTIYAACLAFLIPYAGLKTFESSLSAFSKLAYAGLLFALLISVIFSYSRAAWISLITAFLFLFLIKIGVKFWHLLLIFFVGSLVLVYNFDETYEKLSENEAKYNDNVSLHIASVTNLQNDASNLERINRWVCAFRMFKEKPVAGFGPGTYQFYYDRYQTPEFMTRISTHNGDKGNAHSEYITLLSENGIVGVLIFMLVILYSFYTSLKILRRQISQETKTIVLAAILGLTTFYVHGLFNTFSDFDKMSILVLGSLGVLISLDIKTRTIE
jgi:O-antigen ligase